MKLLVFLSRVAFIYNLCMFAIMITRFFNWVPRETMESTGIVEGFLLGIVLNGLLSIWIVILFFVSRNTIQWKPWWLFAFNFCCFIFQVYLLLK